jgi:hypothetical protein
MGCSDDRSKLAPSTETVSQSDAGSGAVTGLKTFGGQYGLTDDQIRLAHSQWQRLVADCMAEAGYTDYDPTQLPAGPLSDRPLDSRDRDQIATDGFVAVSPSSVLSPTESAVVDRAQRDPEYSKALQGEDDNPSSGCAVKTFALVYGPDSELASAPIELSNLDTEVLFRTQALSDFKKLETDWVQCMDGKGFKYSSRKELANVQWLPPRPTKVEIATALADFDCRAIVNYPERFLRIYDLEHRQVAEERAELVRTLASTIQEYLHALS